MTTNAVADLPAISLSNNADWLETLPTPIEGLDLTPCTLRMQLRRSPEARAVQAEAATPNAIALAEPEEDGTRLSYTIRIPAQAMRRISAGDYIRDVLIEREGSTIYAGRGTVAIVQGVTR